jgi:hypothetical protein
MRQAGGGKALERGRAQRRGARQPGLRRLPFGRELLLGGVLHQGQFSHWSFFSCLDQAETLLDAIEAGIDAIDTHRHVGNLNFHAAHSLREFQDAIVQRVELLADRPQVLQNDVVGLSHSPSYSAATGASWNWA